jgi:CBS domain-containing protein
MTTIDKICSREIVTVSPLAKIAEAARLMRQHHVGAVVVVGGSAGARAPCAILTDRDIAIAVVAEGVDPDQLSVDEVAQAGVITGSFRAPAADIIELMRRHGVRRVPLVDDQGALAGIVTADDLVDFLAREMAAAADMLGRPGVEGPQAGGDLAATTSRDMLRHMARQMESLAKMISREQASEMQLRRRH